MISKKYNPYGLKKGSGMPVRFSDCSEEKKLIDKEYEKFIISPEFVKHSDEMELRMMIDDYEKRCKKIGQGLKRAGEGVKRAGEGLTVTGGLYTGSTVGTTYVGSGYKKGGCHECYSEKKPQKGIGSDLREEMLKRFSK